MNKKLIVLFLLLGFSMIALPSESKAAVVNEPKNSVTTAMPGSAPSFQRNRQRRWRNRRWEIRRNRWERRRDRRWDRRENRRERRRDRREDRRDRRY